MKRYAIIVAGGSGQRMESLVPKQFMELNQKPVLMHTIEKFYSAASSIHIVVVLPKTHHGVWATLCQKHQFSIPHQICEGGASRFQSVRNGLKLCLEDSIIAVHDGVRPLIHPEHILNLYNEAKSKSAVIPVFPILESIRKVEGEASKALDRSQYYSVQTPQCFSSEILLKAYQQKEQETFTDDASVVEAIGKKIHLFNGDRMNIKLTTPEDFVFAEALLNRP
ncbi:MAG: 2-C-methyl-D-erythritol 4-phosphate cytidylyltransferase [Bacteroidetes bacterium MED-G21]|nr:MAG: 2-C-methyl-D-erythritol 4-phosphate cytidylyltransferase [Bacteroidetes bacterium MED-G21]